MTANSTVCVIIAAKNAATTIARAIRSALAEEAVREVVVVDDGSTDHTGAKVLSADDGSGRLKLIRFDHNRGPAAARNCAIEASTAPLLAILDADDFFLPGRFTQIMAEDQWDFIADNIVFVKEESVAQICNGVQRFQNQTRLLDLEAFISGNISRRGKQRGEIGFLKPVMRREFLDRHALRYNEDLRLGEDYDLYARALVAGARYKVIHSCGYGAVVRHDSLSGKHRTDDLKRLYQADQSILANEHLTKSQRLLLRRHEKHVRDRYELRHFLDLKNKNGPFAAMTYAMTHPAAVPAIVAGIIADKREAFITQPKQPTGHGAALRYLLPVMPEAEHP
ncbi:succinoglycan biosynthesis protein ExoU [Agrobacterium vitis]|nr:succinoglycan biosynthesis protein ExoU [Agrobacterium vitis]MBE1439278.1 succinoglycan biosynthesis protein ExoU [Agrobacterium vitis]